MDTFCYIGSRNVAVVVVHDGCHILTTFSTTINKIVHLTLKECVLVHIVIVRLAYSQVYILKLPQPLLQQLFLRLLVVHENSAIVFCH